MVKIDKIQTVILYNSNKFGLNDETNSCIVSSDIKMVLERSRKTGQQDKDS